MQESKTCIYSFLEEKNNCKTLAILIINNFCKKLKTNAVYILSTDYQLRNHVTIKFQHEHLTSEIKCSRPSNRTMVHQKLS